MNKTVLFLLAMLVISSLNAQNFDWVKSMGGATNDESYFMTIDDSGNIYTIGRFEGTADFDPNVGTVNLISQGGGDIFIQKLDASGNLVWAKSIGSVQDESAFGVDVDASGNLYLIGSFSGTLDFDPGSGITNVTSEGESDVFLLKLDANGDFLWVKTIGGSTYDTAYGLSLDNSGNIYITGSYGETVDFDPGAGVFTMTSVGYYDCFVLKIDASGNFVWAKSMGGNGYEYGRYLTVDASENLYIVGYFEETVDFDPGSGTTNLTSQGAGDMFIQKIDALGNLLWVKSIGGSAYDYAHSIAVDGLDNIYISGDYTGTVDFDPGSGVENQTSVGGSGDIFILKLDSTGNFLWAKSFGSMDDDSAFKIAIDESGYIYTSGYFAETVDFDPNSGTAALTSVGDYDIFILKLDASGDFVWTKSMGGIGNDASYAMDVDAAYNVFTTGFYEATVDFDSDSGTANYTSEGYWDVFVHKMTQQNVGLETINNASLTVYPNPTNDKITISGENINNIEITNINGKIINQLQPTGNLVTIDLSEKPNGIYFINVKTKTGVLIKKVVLEN